MSWGHKLGAQRKIRLILPTEVDTKSSEHALVLALTLLPAESPGT